MWKDLPEKCPKCQSSNIIMVEYSWNHPMHYDGVSEILCRDCEVRIGRWTGKELKDGEFENPEARYEQQRP